MRLLPLLALLVTLFTGCSSAPEKKRTVSSPEGRVFNPVSRNYEWRTPGEPSTSPGAENTSRQPYH
jgi:hypothetical protein